MKKLIANALVFQLGWFICVLGDTYFAVTYTLIALIFHYAFIAKNNTEWAAIIIIVLTGCGWDILLAYLGVLEFPTSYPFILPVWLICLWAIFATTYHHCLVWLQKNLLLAALLSAIFAPLSYWAGAQLTSVSIAAPVAQSLGIMAIGWALMFPLGLFISKNLNQQGRKCCD